MQLWVTKIFEYHLQQFLTLESSEHLLHWNQQQIPCLKTLLKSLWQVDFGSETCPLTWVCSRSESGSSGRCLGSFSQLQEEQAQHRPWAALPWLSLHWTVCNSLPGFTWDHKGSCANKSRTGLLSAFSFSSGVLQFLLFLLRDNGSHYLNFIASHFLLTTPPLCLGVVLDFTMV